MTNRVGELIPKNRCLIGKRSLSMGFSSTGWDTENASIRSGTELAGRSVDMKKIRNVGRSKVVKRFEA